MHTCSIEMIPTMKVNIHNQCLDFKLTCMEYFIRGEILNKYPTREVNANDMTSIELKYTLGMFEGAFICELQKETTKMDNQLESPHISLFVAWKSEDDKEHYTCVKLIECDRAFHWDKTKLKKCYQGYTNQLNTYTGLIKDIWLRPDNTVLMTRLELDFTQRDIVLNITISEGVEDDYTKRPEWIDVKK
jgi:hypothetical protein